MPLAYLLAAGHSGGFYRREAVAKGAAASVTRPGAAPRPEVTARAAASMNDRRMPMGGTKDQMKRRIKEAVGVLVDDDRLTSEGKLDQVVGKVKINVERVKGKLQQAVDQMRAALAAKRVSRWTK
jgi:uncharacterized protein YjbJ (UPF0337 family)